MLFRSTLCKRNRIIKAVKQRALKRNYKYGIKVPRNVEDALEIDKETSTSFWRLAIENEMLNVIKGIGDDEFFAIVGALMLPRLNSMQNAVQNRDVPKLATELAAIRDQY